MQVLFDILLRKLKRIPCHYSMNQTQTQVSKNLLYFHSVVEIPRQNLVRFAHNWNDGILEYWNNGLWDNAMLD